MEILSSLFSLILNIGIIALVLITMVLVLLYFKQNSLIYLPEFEGSPKSPSQNMQGLRNPSERKLPYEELEITTLDNQKLRGWLIKQPDSSQVPTVVFFHENAGNIGNRLLYAEHYYQYCKVNFVMVAYRGYSDSTGKPTEAGLQLDGEAIINAVMRRNDIDTQKIFVHGRSLGGAVAIYVLNQNIAAGVRGAILENTFTSLSDMVDTIFSKLKLFKGLVLRNFWPSIQRIERITKPIHFIMSMKDEIVPTQMMVSLYARATNAKSKTQLTIAEGDHNSNWTLDMDSYFGSISNFINKNS